VAGCHERKMASGISRCQSERVGVGGRKLSSFLRFLRAAKPLAPSVVEVAILKHARVPPLSLPLASHRLSFQFQFVVEARPKVMPKSMQAIYSCNLCSEKNLSRLNFTLISLRKLLLTKFISQFYNIFLKS